MTGNTSPRTANPSVKATSPTPHIVIAPDSFKGRASAQEAAAYLGEGVRAVLPDAEITLAPMADGGEGTSAAFSGRTITLPTTDAAGRLTEASYRYDDASATAYIDVAAASGLPAVSDRPVPLTGDTYGTGVLIADAQTRGARTITLALGGTATIDGGTGILVALGATPLTRVATPYPRAAATSARSATSTPRSSISPPPPANGYCCVTSAPPPPAPRARPPCSARRREPSRRTWRSSTRA